MILFTHYIRKLLLRFGMEYRMYLFRDYLISRVTIFFSLFMIFLYISLLIYLDSTFPEKCGFLCPSKLTYFFLFGKHVVISGIYVMFPFVPILRSPNYRLCISRNVWWFSTYVVPFYLHLVLKVFS